MAMPQVRRIAPASCPTRGRLTERELGLTDVDHGQLDRVRAERQSDPPRIFSGRARNRRATGACAAPFAIIVRRTPDIGSGTRDVADA